MSRRPKPEDDVEALLFDLPLHRQAPSAGSTPQPEKAAEGTVASGDETDDEPFGPLPEDPEPQTASAELTELQAAAAELAKLQTAAEAAAAAELVAEPKSRAAKPSEPPIKGRKEPAPPPEDRKEPEPPPQAVEAPNISFAMTLPFDGEAERETARERPDSAGASPPVPASLAALLLAGLLDLGLIFAGMVTAVLGAAALGAAPGREDWPALIALGLALSFPYFVVPMAFWSRSAGMAAFSLFCRSNDGRALSFRQAVIRWFAALLTLATFGLGLLIALTGRSLADRMSGTHTLASHS